MRKKRLILSVTVMLLALLVFSVFYILLSTNTPIVSSSNSQNNQFNTIGNSTTPTNLIGVSSDGRTLFWNFLTEVVGLDSNNYIIDHFSEVQDETDGWLQGSATSVIHATLSNKQVTLNVVMNISERKIRFYDLTVVSGSLDGSSLKNNDFLSASKKILAQYKVVFDTSYIVRPEYVRANYVDDFVRLIPTTIQTEKMSVDKEKMLLMVDFFNNDSSQVKYAKFAWCQKVNDYTDPVLLFQAVFAKTGVLTSFIDGMGVYTVATTRITLSEQDAIVLARPFIDNYAMANGQTVKTIKAEFSYVKDFYNRLLA